MNGEHIFNFSEISVLTSVLTADAMAGEAATAEAPEADMGNMEGDVINGDTGMMVDGTGMSEEPFSIVQSPAAMGGITAGIIALGILAGIVLAKLKIKKGISLYED